MVIRTHGKPSFSKDMKKAQFTILVGEGSNRRSVTRHAERRPGGWFGLNVDPRAIPLNEKYEAEYAEAKRNLASAEGEIDFLKKRLETLEAEPEPSELYSAQETAVYRDELIEAITSARAKAMEADEAVADAKAKLDIVRRDCPLEVEFLGL